MSKHKKIKYIHNILTGFVLINLTFIFGVMILTLTKMTHIITHNISSLHATMLLSIILVFVSSGLINLTHIKTNQAQNNSSFKLHSNSK